MQEVKPVLVPSSLSSAITVTRLLTSNISSLNQAKALCFGLLLYKHRGLVIVAP